MIKKIGANSSYFGNITEAIQTSIHGLKLSIIHLKNALSKRRIGNDSFKKDGYFDPESSMVTLKYPEETLPVPDNGRYKLDLEIDDCIVCDKCAKVCPVDCIEIDPILSQDVIGETSDGTAKRIYAAKFDIDMAKCCFCGLCTYVCPTECLTMTKSYDFSELDMRELTYSFAEMSEEEVTAKKVLFEEAQEKKKAEKLKKDAEQSSKPSTSARPKFSPKVIKKK
ncbi:4Fe-4S dicluster domain-containing protein [Flammeovirga yaeyamensis]|uniref:4Fe-4S dicluster domain-containing protein n=1 Tax=Flammeovirga yaeyamensis TaxID=367791 RepID=A0AAX1N1U4_9BACT|nr:4Fe-4S dicluster domain-containing protein [Flammeovirga yaeyamensis]MBB3696420.1 NADH-quinone oxidoreductase subunit I [Flammeovirga yaeyamensis]NMF35099.1 4Fe-4S dicluster domain-containing protein [Flammeovirga yaeyamensis]QWG00080.1 4Fe-4S dicluster domain-containing protein [Flammeovirga yaeyamensis]